MSLDILQNARSSRISLKCMHCGYVFFTRLKLEMPERRTAVVEREKHGQSNSKADSRKEGAWSDRDSSHPTGLERRRSSFHDAECRRQAKVVRDLTRRKGPLNANQELPNQSTESAKRDHSIGRHRNNFVRGFFFISVGNNETVSWHFPPLSMTKRINSPSMD